MFECTLMSRPRHAKYYTGEVVSTPNCVFDWVFAMVGLLV